MISSNNRLVNRSALSPAQLRAAIAGLSDEQLQVLAGAAGFARPRYNDQAEQYDDNDQSEEFKAYEAEASAVADVCDLLKVSR